LLSLKLVDTSGEDLTVQTGRGVDAIQLARSLGSVIRGCRSFFGFSERHLVLLGRRGLNSI
jgi:hypothetical protein